MLAGGGGQQILARRGASCGGVRPVIVGEVFATLTATPTGATLARDVRRALTELDTVNAPSVRAVRRRFSKELAGEASAVVLGFVRTLLDDGGWSERVVAWEVLAGHEGAFRLVNDRLAEEMADGLSDWASVDLYGVTVLGQAWREGLVTDALIMKWTQSPDRWHRRLALVATVPLNLRSRGGTGDARRTLRVCHALLDDRDDMVVKALSWALRQLAGFDPQAVESFLVKEDGRLAARIKREVRNKLTTGLKLPRRRRATDL